MGGPFRTFMVRFGIPSKLGPPGRAGSGTLPAVGSLFPFRRRVLFRRRVRERWAFVPRLLFRSRRLFFSLDSPMKCLVFNLIVLISVRANGRPFGLTLPFFGCVCLR